MGWRIINISTDDNLRLYLDNLVISRKENKKIIIPLVDIDTIIIESYTATYSNRLLVGLMNYNINIIACDYEHEPFAYFLPINGHHNSLAVFHKQILWNNDFKNQNWKWIIKNKIANQQKTLEHLHIQHNKEEFVNYYTNIEDFDFTNREGHAAKAYWKYLFGEKFIRSRNLEKDSIINSYLNYGYTILRGMFIRSIVKKGLDARIALFHKNPSNFFALASDLMEAFRPVVDVIVYNTLYYGEIKANWKDRILAFLANIKIKLNNKKYFLTTAIDIYVDILKNEEQLPWVDLWE